MLVDFFPQLTPDYFPIVEYVLGRDIHELLSDDTLHICKLDLDKIFTLISKAKAGTPIPYLTNHAYFYKDTFQVDERVLIPRPETEMLVEKTLHFIWQKKLSNLSICDMCCGCGCIGISISKYVSCPHSLILSDISPEALQLCTTNVQNLLGESDFIHILPSNLFKNFPDELVRGINVLVSNPPYIPHPRISKLDSSVKDYEPHLALDGGLNGYEMVLDLLREAKKHMADESLIIIEIGEDQGMILRKEAKSIYPNKAVKVEKDLFGCDRYLIIEPN